MRLAANIRGHVVYVRCVTSPPSWEAACECGYRSERTTEAIAELAAKWHADHATEYVAPKIAKKPTNRARQRAKTARKK